MKTTDFTTTLTLPCPAKDVFNAINNVRAWWSKEITGATDSLNGEWDYHYQDVHRCKLKVVEWIPDQKIVWLVLDNYFSFTTDKKEWIGNTLIFDITEKNNETSLQFTQQGLVPEYECYDICENAWMTYIHKSLFNLITTGEGQPNAKETPQTDDEKKLTQMNFTTTFFVDQTPEQAFTAINNVRGWWQGEIEGITDKLNEEFDYRMPGHHYSRQKIVTLLPGEKIVWSVTKSLLNRFKDEEEWTGTTITFDIHEINNKTQVRFTHEGLIPEFECYGACSNAWSMLIQESLVSLITTGKGKEVF